MFGALLVLGVDVAFLLMAGAAGLMLVIPGVLSLTKAAAYSVLLVHAQQLYSRRPAAEHSEVGGTRRGMAGPGGGVEML